MKNKLIPKHQTPSKPLTKKVEIEDELPEEEIETSEEVNEPIVRVVGVPKGIYIPEPTAPFISGSSHWNEFESDKLNFHWPVDKEGNKINATIPKKGGENNSEKAKNNFQEIQQYWHGPVAEARLKNLGFNDEQYKELVQWIDSMEFSTKGGPGSSYANPLDNKIKINVQFRGTTAPETGLTDVSSDVSHEMAHNIYPRMRWIMTKSNQDRTKFVDFNEHVQKLEVTPEKVKDVYRGAKYFVETPEGWELKPDRGLINFDSDLEHDKNIHEYVPFVYELREAARQAGIWDYTSGEPLTRKKFGELKTKFPQSRLINYTDPDNAIWLLNTTASNNINNKQLNDTETFYAKKGRKLISKNKIKHD